MGDEKKEKHPFKGVSCICFYEYKVSNFNNVYSLENLAISSKRRKKTLFFWNIRKISNDNVQLLHSIMLFLRGSKSASKQWLIVKKKCTI